MNNSPGMFTLGIVATAAFIFCIIMAWSIGIESGMSQCVNYPNDSACIAHKAK